MPITPFQRAQRAKHLGASDSPAIMGLDPWRNAADVYWSKVQPADGDGESSEAMELGEQLEGPLVDWAGQQVGIQFTKNQLRVSQDQPILSASMDGLNAECRVGCEAKTAGILWPTREAWGASGSDEVPDRVAIQVHHQMFVGELDRVVVPALIGGRGRVLYEIKRDDDVIEMIVVAAIKFWQEHVQQRVPPPEVAPHLEVLKAIRRVPEKVVELDSVVMKQWREADAAAKDATKRADICKRAVIAGLGDAEGGTSEAGSVSYLRQSRSHFDAKKFQVDYPGLYEQYTRVGSFPVLRFKKGTTLCLTK